MSPGLGVESQGPIGASTPLDAYTIHRHGYRDAVAVKLPHHQAAAGPSYGRVSSCVNPTIFKLQQSREVDFCAVASPDYCQHGG